MTTKPRKPPATLAAFRKAAERGVVKANPTATVTWVWAKAVTWPGDKSHGFSGLMNVEAPGYAPKQMLATLCGQTLEVR